MEKDREEEIETFETDDEETDGVSNGKDTAEILRGSDLFRDLCCFVLNV